jgi:hypothetical protein
MISRPCGTYRYRDAPDRATSGARDVGAVEDDFAAARRAFKPMMLRNSVVLPAPLRPSTLNIPPLASSSEMPCRMWLVP